MTTQSVDSDNSKPLGSDQPESKVSALVLDHQLMADRLTMENRILRLLQRAEDATEVTKVFATEIERINAFDGFVISLLNRERTHLEWHHVRLPAEYRAIESSYTGLRSSLKSEDPSVRAFVEKRSLLIKKHQLESYSEKIQVRFDRWHANELIAVPIFTDMITDSVGVILAFCKTGSIKPSHRALLEAMGRLFSPSIEAAQKVSDIKKREYLIQGCERERQAFFQFASDIIHVHEKNELFEQVSTHLFEKFDIDVCAFFEKKTEYLEVSRYITKDPTQKIVENKIKSLFKGKGYTLDANEGASVLCLLQNKEILIHDAQEIMHLPMSEKDRKSLAALGSPRTFFFVPLRAKNDVVGVMTLISLSKPCRFDTEAMRYLELLSSCVGGAIQNSNLYHTIDQQKHDIETLNTELENKLTLLKELATKDKLTNLNNYAAFEEEMQRRISAIKRGKPQFDALSFVLIDIDHFKQLNDKYGHPVGNHVLEQVADRIRSVLRKMDFPARYGGEEFAVILPNCNIDGARIFSERIREAMASEPFVSDDLKIVATVSIGFAEFNPEESIDALVARTDKALYAAKHAGRNCVCEAN